MAHPQLFRNLSVNGFCNRARDLCDGAPDKFVRFVLNGVDGDVQVTVDPILNAMPENYELSGLRDFDSLLGIDKNIQVQTALTVFPVPRTEDVLCKNIHIHHDFQSSKGNFSAPVHKIPNLCLGKWQVHNMVRVLIPDLHDDTRSQFLSQEELKIFYEKGLRPAIQRLQIDNAAEWPPTYGSEMFRARGANGQLSFQTKVLPAWCLSVLGNYIRDALTGNGCSWGTGLVFLHQIRGVKHSTSHSCTGVAAVQALEVFLMDNDLPITLRDKTSNWWLDVGIEIASKDQHCLAFRTDSHCYFVQEILEIDEDRAKRITTPGSSKYTRDMTSHLTQVSGCRIAPGVRSRGQYGVVYMQLYTTDKSITYRIDGYHHGKFITAESILKGKATRYIDDLYKLYLNATETSHSLARVEVRVPIRFGCTVLPTLYQEMLENSLVVFPREEWWGLRCYRALAIKWVLEWQADGSPDLRAQKSALMLTAGSAWLLNGLHSAPDKGASCRELMEAILPHVERNGADIDILAYGTATHNDDLNSQDDTDPDDDLPPAAKRRRGNEMVPGFPYGLIFLRPIRLGDAHPVPRLGTDRMYMSSKAFKYFFKVDLEDVEAHYFRPPVVQAANPLRVQNKVKRTVIYVDWEEENTRDFDLARRGIRLPSTERDLGSDVDENEQPVVEEGDGDIDARVTQIWRQFLLDITSKSPNKKAAWEPAYCVLSQAQRLAVNEETYKNRTLSAYFRDCQWKVAERGEWEENFNKLFPGADRGVLYGKVQNYGSAKYYGDWAKLKEAVDADAFTQIRDAVKVKYNRLFWMPAAQSDRIWKTKYDHRFSKSSREPPEKAAPMVLLNGLPPLW